MGAEQSGEEQSDFQQELAKKYSYIRELNDPRFGEIQIYSQNGTDNQIFLKGHWSNSEEDYEEFLSYCKKRKNLNHKNLISMLGFQQQSEEQLCGDFSKITSYYEYLSHNLEKELERRHNRSEFFSEQEVWFILESIVSVCNYLEQNKLTHQDIRPSNVLLTKEGEIKLADQQKFNEKSSKNFQNQAYILDYIRTFTYGEQTYLSPQQIDCLAKKQLKPTYNLQKSEVFSVGLTLLECLTLYSSTSYFDYSSGYINQGMIQQSLQGSKQRYNGFLINLIGQMLQFDDNQRPSFAEIYQVLQPYLNQIQNMQPFVANQQMAKQVNGPQQQYGQPQFVQSSKMIYQQPLQSSPPRMQQQPQFQPNQQQQQGQVFQSQILNYGQQLQPLQQTPLKTLRQPGQTMMGGSQILMGGLQPEQINSQGQVQQQYFNPQSQYQPQQQPELYQQPPPQRFPLSQTTYQPQPPQTQQFQPQSYSQSPQYLNKPVLQYKNQQPSQQQQQFGSQDKYQQQFGQEQNDLDRRVEEALKNSEQTIQRHNDQQYY